jgi:protein gp37
MTTIEWTRSDDGTAGKTWNPILGCDRVSPGCDRCYAMGVARIRQFNPNPKIASAFAGTTSNDGGVDWTGKVNLLGDRLTEPLGWKKPARVFVNSMSDLFHKNVPDEFIARVFAVMALAPQHTFQILTKRHARMRSLIGGPHEVDTERGYAPGVWFRSLVQYATHELGNEVNLFGADSPWPLPNVHLGVSVEDQKWADIRIPALLETPAAVRFLSCEPLLGPIDLGIGDPHRDHDSDDVHGAPHPRVCLTCSTEDEHNVEYFRREPDSGGIDWVIVGGESGPGARPLNPDWVRSIVGECRDAGTAPFVKQLGSVWAKANGASDGKGGEPADWPADLRVREYPKAVSA